MQRMQQEDVIREILSDINGGERRVYFFHGRSGCGKTMTVYRVAELLGLKVYRTFPGNAVSDKKVLRKYITEVPLVVVEYDATYYSNLDPVYRFMDQYDNAVAVFFVTSVYDPHSQFGLRSGSNEEREFCTKFKVYDMNTMKLIYS